MTALDYFDTPEDGWEAHEAGYKQSDCPFPLGSGAGLSWAKAWGEREKSSRAIDGTYGATDEDYVAGGLAPPPRDESGRRADLGGDRFAVFQPSSFVTLWRQSSDLAASMQRAADAMRAIVLGYAPIVSFPIHHLDPAAIALYYGVPTRLVGIDPEPAPKAEPALPPAWATTKRDELLRPVLEPAHLEDRPLRTYLLDQPGPLEVAYAEDRHVYGILPPGVRRLD